MPHWGQKLDYEIVQSGGWRPQFLVAKSFGRKRVYIAGDATHQYMPTGGLGMNTGVTEAHNLAWKLAAMVHGWGGEQLMASYEAERLPIARSNREHVQRCAAAAFEINFPVANRANLTEYGPHFEQTIVRLYESLGIEIGYRYTASSIICPNSGSSPPYEDRDYAPAIWNGARLPSAFRADGTAVFDQLGSGRFTLLVTGGDGTPLKEAADQVSMPLETISITEPELVALYPNRFVLVRPDQHVCWHGDALPDDCSQLVDKVRGAES